MLIQHLCDLPEVFSNFYVFHLCFRLINIIFCYKNNGKAIFFVTVITNTHFSSGSLFLTLKMKLETKPPMPNNILNKFQETRLLIKYYSSRKNYDKVIFFYITSMPFCKSFIDITAIKRSAHEIKMQEKPYNLHNEVIFYVLS